MGAPQKHCARPSGICRHPAARIPDRVLPCREGALPSILGVQGNSRISPRSKLSTKPKQRKPKARRVTVRVPNSLHHSHLGEDHRAETGEASDLLVEANGTANRWLICSPE